MLKQLALGRIAPSIGTIGDAYDDSLIETTIVLYTTECIRPTIFNDRRYVAVTDVEYATAGWADRYNSRRLNGSVGMASPNEFETDYYKTLTRESLPT